jgi:hypothetical protein
VLNWKDEYVLTTSLTLARENLDLTPQAAIQVAAEPDRPVDDDRWELPMLSWNLR